MAQFRPPGNWRRSRHKNFSRIFALKGGGLNPYDAKSQLFPQGEFPGELLYQLLIAEQDNTPIIQVLFLGLRRPQNLVFICPLCHGVGEIYERKIIMKGCLPQGSELVAISSLKDDIRSSGDICMVSTISVFIVLEQ